MCQHARVDVINGCNVNNQPVHIIGAIPAVRASARSGARRPFGCGFAILVLVLVLASSVRVGGDAIHLDVPFTLAPVVLRSPLHQHVSRQTPPRDANARIDRSQETQAYERGRVEDLGGCVYGEYVAE